MNYKVSNCYPLCIMCMAAVWLAVLSSRRPWIDVSALPRKFQHGGDWEWSRPHDPKNVNNFLIAVRPLSWACGHGTKILLILKKLFLTWLLPDIFQYDSPKKCPTILYAVNLWLKPVAWSAECTPCGSQAIFVFRSEMVSYLTCPGHAPVMTSIHTTDPGKQETLSLVWRDHWVQWPALQGVCYILRGIFLTRSHVAVMMIFL